ncbi:uncharacterized protein [Branchiostoma lanceolatum]|uniref:uncharacterized protein n=1 Tax=Branchiostoma lanceolatum TaxID=7740 RepID=UPI0034560481
MMGTTTVEIPAILLLHVEYGKFKEGISSIHRQLVLTLWEHVPDTPLFSTVLKAAEADIRDAQQDGVKLLLPQVDPDDPRTDPSLAWLTFDHDVKYPHLPSKVKTIVGYFNITSRAAIRIKKKLFPDAKVILFAHDIPEDTEYYKGDEKEKSILEDAQEADVVFSLGNKIFDHFENQFRGIPAEKRPQHFKFVPRPSKIFEDAKPEYKDTKTMVVLSIVGVQGVETLKGLDIAAEALRIVAERMNIKWRVRGASKDYFQKYLGRSKLEIRPLPCGTQEDICKDMMQAHLFLMPSRAEPFGLMGLEAIAAGVPVLVCSKSGLADFIDEHIEELHHSIVDMDEREKGTGKRFG